MRIFARFAFATALVTAGIMAACGEDTARVAVRGDAGVPDGGDAGLTVLSCGVVVPNSYDSAAFTTNAKEELDLAAGFESLDGRMKAAEGTGTSVVTTAELRGIYEQGTPSLKSASTSAAQAFVDGYFVSFGDAVGKTWAPDLVDSADAGDGGDAGAPLSGGKYGGTYIFSSVGVDLREATAKTLLAGAFYNHALVVASGPVTEAAVDRLLASYGASTKFLATTDADAGSDADRLIAEYASKRDDKTQAALGPYRRIRVALLSAKTAAAAGPKCSADLDASIKVFFAEWEKTTYASAIYYLNDAAANAIGLKGDVALHSFGEALGFLQSFRGVTQDRRKITDAQIDDLLAKIGAATPYKLVTQTSDRVPKLVEAINTIALIYGFSPSDVEAFEKSF